MSVQHTCPACDGKGHVTDYQFEDPEMHGLGPDPIGFPIEHACELCGGGKTVSTYLYDDFMGTINAVPQVAPINPEIIRLIQQEGVELRISGHHRSGFNAGLNTNCGSSSVWLAESDWFPTIQEAVQAVLTDQSIQPEVDV